MKTLLVLTLRQMLGGKKIWILILFLSLPILLLTAVLVAGGFDFPEEAQDEADFEGLAWSAFLYVMYPQSLCILASLLYGASLLAGEIEDKTLVYLFTRALPRWRVLVGKYVATALVLTALSVASMSVSYLLLGLPIGAEVWIAVATSIAGACFTYTAIFCLLGLLVPRRAIPVGLVYAVVIEGLLSVVPAVVNTMTAAYYLRSMAWHILDFEMPAEIAEEFNREAAPFLAGADVPSALLTLAAISAGTLILSGVIIHRRQWPLTEGV